MADAGFDAADANRDMACSASAVMVNRTRAGRTLRMGCATGGLRASDDAGDTWRTLSPDLPMVHAVRLG